MWETIDPDGRIVTLAFARWRHILARHPELAGLREAILSAVMAPNARHAGHESNEEWFYTSGQGPTRFIWVVVHFSEGSGRITTAFPRRRVP
jgi:hypothetical protein